MLMEVDVPLTVQLFADVMAILYVLELRGDESVVPDVVMRRPAAGFAATTFDKSPPSP
jgi:hypothetical protein